MAQTKITSILLHAHTHTHTMENFRYIHSKTKEMLCLMSHNFHLISWLHHIYRQEIEEEITWAISVVIVSCFVVVVAVVVFGNHPKKM